MGENIIELTLREHIAQQEAFFVFPTQTAADLWADRIVLTGITGAVATERFIAWDQFKGESIRSTHQDKTSVPSVMRRIFSEQLIAQNAASPFLKHIVSPDYAQSAGGFSEWISCILPGLSLWKKYFDRNGGTPDEEDSDLLELYGRYKTFLEKHSLFDPAWETPPFRADGRHFYIFFPEILSDYAEYRTILEAAEDNITLVHRNPNPAETKPPVIFFEDSRAEIKHAVLFIRELHEKNNIPWTDIALNVPDMESYGAYITRELELYQIPHVLRYARPLSASEAGNFFRQAQKCVSEKFSFPSVKELLMNTSLPWKHEEALSQLIEFGKENNCICSFDYAGKKIDVWEESFRTVRTEELARAFYRELKKRLTELVCSKSFAEIRRNYFEFRNKFFDMNQCPPQSDRIISRCISELADLIDLEQKFPDCMVSDNFSFFTDCLSRQNYLEQTDERGVQIIPYRLGACAPFSCHIILDASQNAISVIYRELSFLREDKRSALLKQEDSNVTEEFISLYNMNSFCRNAYFSAGGKTFSGYSQASSYLTELKPSENAAGTDCMNQSGCGTEDMYGKEKEWFGTFYSEKQSLFPERITQIQKRGFSFWRDCQKSAETYTAPDFAVTEGKIKEYRYKDGKIRISATHLKKFFDCPRAWLQNYITGLKQQENEAALMDQFAMGNLYHKILELYCTGLKDSGMIIHTGKDGLEEDCLQLLEKSVDTAVETEDNSYLEKELLKTTRTALGTEIRKTVENFSKIFEGCFVVDMEKKLYYEVPEKNCIFEGKTDCLLYDSSECEFILIDFKSSVIPENLYYTEENADSTAEKEHELPDFQMPMYIYLLKNQKSPVIVENCGFFSIKAGCCVPVTGKNLQTRSFVIKKPRSPKEPVTAEDFEPTIRKFLECADEYAKRIKEGDFCIDDSRQDFSKCNSCDYRAVCRRVFNISRQK